MPPILITDTTGGESDLHPSTLPDSQLAIAQDVDFYRTTLCNRRNGSLVVASGLPAEVNSLIVNLPQDTIGELWALDADGVWASFDTTYARTAHRPSPAETFTQDIATGATLHGKLFLAARTLGPPSGLAVPRLHVWDGSTLRRTGLAAPTAAPIASDYGLGLANCYGTRYYRVRYLVMAGDTILRRSEPSPQVTFNPLGDGLGVYVEKPAATSPSEGETHWEVEESTDLEQGDWYRIATLPVGTTTYTDTTIAPQDVAIAEGAVLAADIGDYNLQASYRWVIADRDRLLGAGNFEDEAQDAAVEWSVVGDDVTGVGNDERRPTTSVNRLDLDGQVSGPITGFFNYDGRIIAQKMHRTYELTHTGIRTNAYLPRVLSNTYGALPFSGVEGVDRTGKPVLYFVDPNVGPMALTQGGFSVLAPHLRDKFLSEVNFEASHVCYALYHAQRRQVWWHFAGVRNNGRGPCPPSSVLPDYASYRWVFDVYSGGFSFHSIPRLTHAGAFWPDKPIIAAEGGGLVRCDHDGAQDDYGHGFRAYIQSRAYEPETLVGRCVIRSAIVEGRPIQVGPNSRIGSTLPSGLAPSGVHLGLTLIRDYGLERRTVLFSLDPKAHEDYVIKPLDSARIAEATAVQVEVGDVTAVSTFPWSLYRIALKEDPQGSNIQ